MLAKKKNIELKLFVESDRTGDKKRRVAPAKKREKIDWGGWKGRGPVYEKNPGSYQVN